MQLRTLKGSSSRNLLTGLLVSLLLIGSVVLLPRSIAYSSQSADTANIPSNAANYLIVQQNEDGSWSKGESPLPI
ncbi:MAG: hypothetical protein JXB29_07175 [Sedimentisphaerales bacterium]|nr:hypothetical protein [Sedimentisphaerales bacterium]